MIICGLIAFVIVDILGIVAVIKMERKNKK